MSKFNVATADNSVIIRDLTWAELDLVDGAGISVSWSNNNTNWGSVLAWGAGGAIAGSGGGLVGAGLGAFGGAAADYVSQHLNITID